MTQNQIERNIGMPLLWGMIRDVGDDRHKSNQAYHGQAIWSNIISISLQLLASQKETCYTDNVFCVLLIPLQYLLQIQNAMPPNISYAHVRADDLRRVAQNRRGFWLSVFLLIIVVILITTLGYVGWTRIAEGYIPLQMGLFASIGLTLAPSIIWLLTLALGVGENKSIRRISFLLWTVTGVIYFVVIAPVLANFFQISDWLHVTWWSDLLGRLLIIAPLEVFLVYLVLRLGIYPSESMQTLGDGLVYGMAAGLGVATAINLMELWTPGFSSLTIQTFRVGEISLVYATIGAWVGYFLACARFKRINVFYLASGVLLTVFLHALCFFVLGIVSVQTLWPHPLGGVTIAAAFILVSMSIIFWRIRKCGKAFMRIAALVEIKAEQETPRSVLAEVVQMVETNQFEPRPSPPPPPPDSIAPMDKDAPGELESLKQSWEALIAEQENQHD